VFYFDCETIDSITLTEVVASNFQSETHGGFFYFETFDGSLIIDGTTGTQPSFKDFSASTAGSFLYSEATNIDISIYNSIFECDSSQTATGLETTVDTDLFTDDPEEASRAGAFWIEDPDKSAVVVTSSDNQYRYCSIATTGGVYSLTDVEAFNEDRSTYEYNAAITGGAIKCDGCTMTIDDATFTYNYANQGGTFLFDNDAAAVIDSTIITESYTYGDGGAIAAIKTTLDVI